MSVIMPDVYLPQQTAWRRAVMSVWHRQPFIIGPDEKFIIQAVMLQGLLELTGEYLRDGRRHGKLRLLRSGVVGEVVLLLVGSGPRFHPVWDNAGDKRLAYQPGRWKGHIAAPPLRQDIEMAETLATTTLALAKKDEEFAMKLPHPYEVAPWLRMEG